MPLEVTCAADPSSGPAPLEVQFGATPSGATGVYDYLWEFGTGDISREKRVKHTYKNEGVFTAVVTVKSGSQQATCRKTITVGKTSGTVTVTTAWNTAYESGSVVSAPSGIACSFVAPAAISGTCSAPFAVGAPLTLRLSCLAGTPEWVSGCDSVSGDQCMLSPSADRTVQLKCYTATGSSSTSDTVWPTRTLRTSLEAQGARGRATIDGAGLLSVEAGGLRHLELGSTGSRRVEAVVDQIGGPGLWRFSVEGAAPQDSVLRVQVGAAVTISANAVVFRLTGKPGERIAFVIGTPGK